MNTWDTSAIEITDSNYDFTPVHELRKTHEGRRKLHKSGKSLTGYLSTGSGHSVPMSERRFVAWDGEGVQNGDKHNYVLFGNSDGKHVKDYSLGTRDCLSLLIENAEKDAIHFGFAFGYDVNMILRDVSENHLRTLRKEKSVIWGPWRIEYVPRKWFMVTDRYARITVKVWDVWSFFMTSFVKACEQYDVALDETVTAGKEDRKSFSYWELESTILPYWKQENKKAVELLDKLRDSLHAADLYISQWHGPGAIANYSMGKHKIDRAKKDPPKEVLTASQYGYGGGRFELFKIGRANMPVYEYDINSAYPFAISQLPNLANGDWEHVTNPTEIARFGIYRISWMQNPYDPMSNLLKPMPYFHRDSTGQISFPCVVDTWVWSPELWGTKRFPGLVIHEGWVFRENDPADRPFDWVRQNYEIRKRYKDEGNPAQLALKLQLNSMYGKMAQRVGWNEKENTAPKWHELEWAGWVVSYCRAMVFRAGLLCGSDIVAFETDAVFSTKSIRAELESRGQIGDALGMWEETAYDNFVYIQSGCRFGLNPRIDGKLKYNGWQEKYRGFDKGSLNVMDALDVLKRPPDHWRMTGKTTRFVGFAEALQTDMNRWRTFEHRNDRTLTIGGEGKRQHVKHLCRACDAGRSGADGFHDAVLTRPIGEQSAKHPLPWRDMELLQTQTLADNEKWSVEDD